jgi:hypothetical protein
MDANAITLVFTAIAGTFVLAAFGIGFAVAKLL